MIVSIDNVKKNVCHIHILKWGNRQWQFNRIFPEGELPIARDREDDLQEFLISGEQSEHVYSDSKMITTYKATVECRW